MHSANCKCSNPLKHELMDSQNNIDNLQEAQDLSKYKISILQSLLQTQKDKLSLFKMQLDMDKMDYYREMMENMPQKPPCGCRVQSPRPCPPQMGRPPMCGHPPMYGPPPKCGPPPMRCPPPTCGPPRMCGPPMRKPPMGRPPMGRPVGKLSVQPPRCPDGTCPLPQR